MMAVEYFALERHSRTDANDIVGWENLDSIVERTCEARGWLLKLQNRDGGWPTFCRGWGKLQPIHHNDLSRARPLIPAKDGHAQAPACVAAAPARTRS